MPPRRRAALLPGHPICPALDSPSILAAMFEKVMKALFGSKHEKDVKRARPLVEEINRYFEEYQSLSDDDLRGKTAEFKARLAEETDGLEDEKEIREVEGEVLTELLPEAFAVVKEACRRHVGQSWPVVGIEIGWDMVPYDVQLIGGMMLHEGKIAEMATGEGKTLVATTAALLECAHWPCGAYLVTVNDYLAASRQRAWMGPGLLATWA